jgi:RNA polymerase sigma factor (sigma-70 family)
MAKGTTAVLQEVIRNAGGRAKGGSSDRELLRRFAEDGDQTAFAALFKRHSGMVLGVCRRMLPGLQDAEDACQACFLLLSRKAGTERWQPSIANWLYLTARRVARNARVVAERRARHEGHAPVQEAAPAVDRMTGRELLDSLDEELDRLPQLYREPLVLCYLEGLTRDEAATRLGVPQATVKTRLERGRKRLGDALAKRGWAAGAGLLALAATSSAEAAPFRLADEIVAGATGSAPAAIVRMAEAATPKLTKTWMWILVLLGAGMLSLKVAAWSSTALPPDDKPTAPNSEKPDVPAKPAEPKLLTYSGRVVDAGGKPVAGAKLRMPLNSQPPFSDLMELATTAADGTFSFNLKSVASGPDFRNVVASAPGLGPDWASFSELKPDAPITFHLAPDDVVVRGRVVDLEGRPVSSARVSVIAIWATKSGSLDQIIAQSKIDPEKASHMAERVMHFTASAGIPSPVEADKDGRFEVKGVGRNRMLTLLFSGDGIETAAARVLTDPRFEPKPMLAKPDAMNAPSMSRTNLPFYGPEFTHVSRPSAVIKGVVTDAKTGKALAGVHVRGNTENSWWENSSSTKTDADGRYRLTGVAKANRRRLFFWPGASSSYLQAALVLKDEPGLSETTADAKLTRGVVVNGRITDKSTGKPIQSAGVFYSPLAENPYFSKTPGSEVFRFVSSSYSTDANGAFRLVALPGIGLISAQDDTRGTPLNIRYTQVRARPADEPRLVKEVQAGLGDAFLSADGHYETLHGKSAYKIISPAEDADSIAVELQFDPAKSITGKVVDLDGQPAAGVMAYGLSAVFSRPEKLKDGSFTAIAVEPANPRIVTFVDGARKLAGAVKLSGNEKEPVVVQLRKWAALTGRVVDVDGQPCAKAGVFYAISERGINSGYRVAGGTNEVKTGADGRFRLDIQFAGAAFRLGLQHQGKFAEVDKKLTEFKIEPGETKDLGDLKFKPE